MVALSVLAFIQRSLVNHLWMQKILGGSGKRFHSCVVATITGLSGSIGNVGEAGQRISATRIN
jgi:hypothetical protein